MSRQSNFSGKVTHNAHEQKNRVSNYGVLNLPNDLPIFVPEPDSRVKIDFIPYVVTDKKHPDCNEELEIAVVGTEWYRRPFSVHRNVGANNETVVCLESVGKKCPICEYRKKNAKDMSKEEIKALYPTRRNLYAIIPLDSKKYEEKLHIWDSSQFLFQELLNKELEENPDNGCFPDLQEGLSLKIRFDSAQFGNSKPYAEASRIDFLERDQTYDAKILKDVPNLDNLLKVLSFDVLEAKFFEIDDETDSDTEPEEKEPITRRREKSAEPEKPVRGVRNLEKPFVDEKPKDLTWEDLKASRFRKLNQIIEDNNLSLDINDYKDADDDELDDVRKAIAEALNVKIIVGTRQVQSRHVERGDEKPASTRSNNRPVRETVKEPEKPTRRSQPEVVARGGKKVCPSGYTFGKDCDKHDACETCTLFNDCLDAQ
jgi:hypothetical protein